MKRYGNLFNKIAEKENLLLAFKKAKRHKSKVFKIQEFAKRKEKLCDELRNALLSGKYKTSEYAFKKVYEPKERDIWILPFWPDRVLHHAIMNVVEKIWDSLFYYGSYACRVGKGQHVASKKCMAFCRRYKYVLKCDVSKFYPSVSHSILKSILRRKLKDDRLLALLDEIIDSTGEDIGVPIGNYLSQWFGNLYLNELDTLVKHDLKAPAYLRYCDDFLFFADDKTTLHGYAETVKAFLSERLQLRLSKCELFPCTQGIDFLGYRHFPAGYILVRKATAKRIKRRLAAIPVLLSSGRMTPEKARAQLASAHGWMSHACTHNLGVSLQIDTLTEYVNALV